MTRSTISLLIMAALALMGLSYAGVVSWTPTPWETHAVHTLAKDAGSAAKAIGLKVNIPPKPEGTPPAPSTGPRYTTASGQQVAAPTAQASVTAAYCQLEGIPSGEDGCP